MSLRAANKQTCLVTVTPNFIEIGETSFDSIAVCGIPIVEEETIAPAFTLEAEVFLSLS